ncbi:MAG: M48 family metallopeptidase [Nitrososphaerota archaeon]|nr:M48 family metallopeptidase [Nitrososphaerota archaeon]MDG7038158.1 M48 family metallopeptidase [Nitrososphaerota archaeon]MDG7043439.1 M48 family metallopeptidase [Nitrososphaerota archaeon]
MNKDIQVIRAKRKTISLHVREDASVVLYAPYEVADRYIEEFIQRHNVWIQKKKGLMVKRLTEEPHHGFEDGEELLYLGNLYRLNRKDFNSPVWNGDSFNVLKGADIDVASILTKWYREAALNVITQRVKFFTSINGLKYRCVKISNANRKWGSCSVQGDLRFSWKLVMAPLPVIDYVVAHELAHLRVRNHSKAFWKQVGLLQPGYETNRAWLNENGHMLKL